MLDKQIILNKLNKHVGKHWKTVSLALLLALGGGVAVSQQNNAHASTITPNANQTRNINGNKGKLVVPKVINPTGHNIIQNNPNYTQNAPKINSSAPKSVATPNLTRVNNDQQQINKLNQQNQQKQQKQLFHVNNGTANASWLNHLGVNGNHKNATGNGFNGFGEKPTSGEDVINSVNNSKHIAKPASASNNIHNNVKSANTNNKRNARSANTNINIKSINKHTNIKPAKNNGIKSASNNTNKRNNIKPTSNNIKPTRHINKHNNVKPASITNANPRPASDNYNNLINSLNNEVNDPGNNQKSDNDIDDSQNFSNSINSLKAQESSANAQANSIAQSISNHDPSMNKWLPNNFFNNVHRPQSSAPRIPGHTYKDGIDLTSLDNSTDSIMAPKLNPNTPPTPKVASEANSIAGTDHYDGTPDNNDNAKGIVIFGNDNLSNMQESTPIKYARKYTKSYF